MKQKIREIEKANNLLQGILDIEEGAERGQLGKKHNILAQIIGGVEK